MSNSGQKVNDYNVKDLTENEYINFKEHSIIGLNDDGKIIDEKYFNLTKINLLKVTKSTGLVITAFKNILRIFSVSELESKSGKDLKSGKELNLKNVPSIAEHTIYGNEIITLLDLNCDNTILAVLSLNMDETANTINQYLYEFTLVDAKKNLSLTENKRFHLNSENVENTLVTDFSFSPSEKDLFALCTSGGVIQLWKFNTDIAKESKDHKARCLCWSPKGKYLAVCTNDNKLIHLEIKDLSEIKRFSIPLDKCIPNEVVWYSTKAYFITYINQDNQDNQDNKKTKVRYIEASTKNPNNVRIISVDDAILEVIDKPNENPMSYFDYINEWNLVLFITSKSTELVTLERSESHGFSCQVLDDTSRALLPLVNGKDTSHPLGLGISYNTQKEIVLDDKPVPVSPLMIMLNNFGQLVTYYILNLGPGVLPICTPPSIIYNQVSNPSSNILKI